MRFGYVGAVDVSILATVLVLVGVFYNHSVHAADVQLLSHLLVERQVKLSADGIITGSDSFVSRIHCPASSPSGIDLPSSTKDTKVTNGWIEYRCSEETASYGYEFSTSINGFQDLFADHFIISTSLPVDIVRYQLILPKKQKIRYHFQGHGDEVSVPDVEKIQNKYEWLFSSVIPDKNQASLFVSADMTWDDISNRYAELWFEQCGGFVVPQPSDLGITDQEPEGMVQEVLTYFKKHFTYKAVFEDGHWRTPDACRDVWERRWGDCKDITLLVGTMLNTWGVQTTPVLLGRFQESINFPEPFIFTHVVLKVALLDAGQLVDVSSGSFINKQDKYVYLPFKLSGGVDTISLESVSESVKP